MLVVRIGNESNYVLVFILFIDKSKRFWFLIIIFFINDKNKILKSFYNFNY